MTTTSPGFGVPYRDSALAEGKIAGRDGKERAISVRVTDVWWQFLVGISQQSARLPIAPLVPDPSPYEYTADQIGTLVVRGGTVSSIQLVRGNDVVDVTGMVGIPLTANDSVVVTYSVVPTVTFVPGART